MVDVESLQLVPVTGNNHIVTCTHLAKAREFIAIPSSSYSTLATCQISRVNGIFFYITIMISRGDIILHSTTEKFG